MQAKNARCKFSEMNEQTADEIIAEIKAAKSLIADGAVVRYQFNGYSYQVLKAEQPSEAFVKGMKYVDAQAINRIKKRNRRIKMAIFLILIIAILTAFLK